MSNSGKSFQTLLLQSALVILGVTLFGLAVHAQGYSGSVAYTPSKQNAVAPTPVGNQLPGTFQPPPVGASPEVMQQAITSFMQYLSGVDSANNPQGFPDWVNPLEVRRRSNAPPLPPARSSSLNGSCAGLPKDAVDRMKTYLEQCSGNLSVPTGRVAITDFSTNTPVMYILNKEDLSCVGSVPVSFGTGSHGPRPTAGNGHGTHRTPAGFMITKAHHGRLYQEWNSIGLAGMGSENNNTVGRGVIMHPSVGHTQGCIGIRPEQFLSVKRDLAYGSVVLNYFPGQIGSSQHRCPATKSAGSFRTQQRAGIK